MGPFGSISEAWAALQRQAWLIVTILAVGLPGVYFFAKSQPRYYEASGVLAIQGPQDSSVMPAGAPLPGTRISDRMDEIERIILSRENVLRIIDDYDLFPEIESETIRIVLTREAISFNRLIDPSEYGRPDPQPYGLSISVRLEDPEEATTLANDLLGEAVNQDLKLASARMTSTLEQMNNILGYLRAEEDRVGVEIDAVEAEIAEFRTTNAISLPEGLPILRERLAELEPQRATIDREIRELERNQGQLSAASAERLRAQLDNRRALIMEEIASTRAALERGPEVERQLGALTRRLATLEAELQAIAMQRSQASMSQTFASGSDSSHLVILEEALLPEFPASRSRRKIALAAWAAVAAFAFGLALARELMHPVIRTAAQMQRQLDIAPVVVIPFIAPPPKPYRRVATAAGLVTILLILSWAAWTQFNQATPGTIFNLLARDVPVWLGGDEASSQ